jgi:hypothetical protein
MWITYVICTFIVIITNYRSIYTRARSFFGLGITRISGTIVIIITDDLLVYASTRRLTIGAVT